MKYGSPRFETIISTKAWFWIELACLAFLAFLLLGKGVLPGWHRLNSDFPNDYVVARLLHDGFSLDRIYDWVWLQRIKDHWGLDVPLVDFPGQPPISVLPLLPLAGFAALTAKRIWIVANLLFLLVTAETLHRVTQLGRRRIWILTLLAIIPLRSSFLLGQLHILVLLLFVLAYFFRARGRGVACGICVAAAAALKVYPLMFAFYFGWKKQWREALSIVGATIALLGVSYLCFGGHVMHIYLTQVLPRSMQGEVIDQYNVRAMSAVAFLHRLFVFEPGLNPAPVWNRPHLYSIVYPLWQVAVLFPLFLSIRPSSKGRDTEKLEWAVFLLALLMLSPQPSSYHFVVMILPIVLVVDVLFKRQQCGWSAVVILLYVMMCGVVISPAKASAGFTFLTVIAFSRLWIGLLLLMFLVLYLWHENELQESRRSVALRASLLGAVMCVFWIAGFVSYQRHFAHFDEDIRARLPLPIRPLLLATGIHPSAGGYVTTAVVRSDYRVIDQNGQSVLPSVEGGTDQLSSAGTANRPSVFVEVADKNGSRIVLRDAPAFQIANAESPAISADGSALAYIREEKGRGSLRLAHLASSSGAITVTGDAELVGEPYDVRDAAVAPSGNIVFAARVDDEMKIYQIAPGGKPAVLIAGGEEMDEPNASPDGRRLVFRKLLHSRWQLVMMDLSTRQERQLTFGDCSAFAPAWMNESTIGYATDCGRGQGFTALASIDVGK